MEEDQSAMLLSNDANFSSLRSRNGVDEDEEGAEMRVVASSMDEQPAALMAGLVS